MADAKEMSAKFVGASAHSTAKIHSIIVTKDVNGKSQDYHVLGDLFNLIIEEDLYSFVLHGTITFKDRYNFFEMSPFIGNETLKIDIRSLFAENVTLNRTFNITSALFRKESAGDKGGVVVLTFKDKDNINFYKEYSTSMKEIAISAFVKDFLIKNMGASENKLDFEITDGNFSFAFPYQKPIHMLRYLNKFAKSTNKEYNYLLYSSIRDGYTYKPLTGLIKQTPVIQYTEDVPEKVRYKLNSFSEYIPTVQIDIEKLLLERGIGSTIRYFDPATKSVKTEELLLSTFLSELKLGYKYNYTTKQFESPSYFNHYQVNKNSHINKIEMLNSYVEQAPGITITIKGLMERAVGQMVKMKFMDKAMSKLNEDTMWSGKYLTKNISHIFSTNDYRQTILFKRYGSFESDSKTQDI